MKKRRVTRTPKRTKISFSSIILKISALFALLVGLCCIVLIAQSRQTLLGRAAPSAELQTDKTNQSFTGGGYTSEYHIYAAGLDWSKPVGLLMYTDGSGESGLKDPDGEYLMAGPTGMIAVAKKHNMVLVTPMSPNKACTDGSEPESCWYEGDSPGYAKWAEALITQIETQYSIDKKRVAVGGYSSGATFTTGWWVPSGAAQRTMDDGVIVAISYGGEALMNEVAYTPAFKANVHMNWNGGDADESYPTVKEGQAHYTAAGFQTSLDTIPGKGHDRGREFGPIMDAMITKHVPPATGSPATGGNVPAPTEVAPTYFCGGSNSCVPSGAAPSQTVGSPGTNPLTSGVPVTTDEPVNPNPIDPGMGGLSPVPQENPSAPSHGGDRQGLIAILIAFIMGILQLLLSLFR